MPTQPPAVIAHMPRPQFVSIPAGGSCSASLDGTGSRHQGQNSHRRSSSTRPQVGHFGARFSSTASHLTALSPAIDPCCSTLSDTNCSPPSPRAPLSRVPLVSLCAGSFTWRAALTWHLIYLAIWGPIGQVAGVPSDDCYGTVAFGVARWGQVNCVHTRLYSQRPLARPKETVAPITSPQRRHSSMPNKRRNPRQRPSVTRYASSGRPGRGQQLSSPQTFDRMTPTQTTTGS